MGQFERKQEIVDGCLDTFMKKGLAHTSTKDLCDALKLNSGGVFYYFKTRDDIVIACAEEAKKRIERDIFTVAINDIDYPDKLSADLYARATEMRPLMKFFVSVYATEKYESKLRESLVRLSARYELYVKQFAKKLNSTPEEVAPYVYIVINTMLSFMLFGEKGFVAPQIELVYGKVVSLLEKNRKQSIKDESERKE